MSATNRNAAENGDENIGPHFKKRNKAKDNQNFYLIDNAMPSVNLSLSKPHPSHRTTLPLRSRLHYVYQI